jgi:hypothetical protein
MLILHDRGELDHDATVASCVQGVDNPIFKRVTVR